MALILMMPIEKSMLEDALGEKILQVDFFSSGQIGDIFKLQTSQKAYLLKTSAPSEKLAIEARMLSDLFSYDIRVPQVYDVSPTTLLMEYIAPVSHRQNSEEVEAARLLCKLHSVGNESHMYGYYYDTTIGPFMQKNEQTQYHWALFLGQMRILPMAKRCYDQGLLSSSSLNQLEMLCKNLYQRIDMSQITPSLLHGDLWSGNILFGASGATLIDPALYFGDREMELAFILLFNTFGDPFFETYCQHFPLSDDFERVKVPLYQIYPILVHIALYGGSYLTMLENRLERLRI